MSKKCRAYSESRLGLEPSDQRRAFYAGWDAALRERLEQPKQEPVAWRTFDGEGGWELIYYEGNESYRLDYIKRNGERYASWVEPLYAHPPESHSEAYRQSETIRMQDKELNELRAAAQMALENLDVISDWLQNTGNDHLCDEYAVTLDAIDALRAALEGQTTPDKLIEQAEPVAWDWLPSDARDKWVIGAPQRKPLTDEQIAELIVFDFVAFTRAIELAHGIGNEK